MEDNDYQMKSHKVVEIRQSTTSGKLALFSARLSIENLKVLSSAEGSFDSLSLCRELLLAMKDCLSDANSSAQALP